MNINEHPIKSKLEDPSTCDKYSNRIKTAFPCPSNGRSINIEHRLSKNLPILHFTLLKQIRLDTEKADEGAKEALRQCLPPQSTVISQYDHQSKIQRKQNYLTNLATIRELHDSF
jgi:hypothetical protein